MTCATMSSSYSLIAVFVVVDIDMHDDELIDRVQSWIKHEVIDWSVVK